MVYIVATDVELKPISQTNMSKNRAVRREATQKQAMRITNASHDFIIDEITRRERLQYIPSMVVVVENESDSDSNDEE